MAKKLPNPYGDDDVWFVRVFSKKKYAEQFVAGELRMGSLNVYRGIEDGGKRGDPDEGALFRGSDFTLVYTPRGAAGRGIEPIVISNPQMVRGHSEEFNQRCHILCMNTLRLSQGTRYGVLRLPRHMWKFGDYAVLTRGRYLLHSIQQYCRRSGLDWGCGFVRYVPENYSGEWNEFTKTKKYSVQREFRIVMLRDDGEPASDFLLKSVGPLPHVGIVKTRTVSRLGVPCDKCGGHTSGLAAPDQRRRRRVQKKIDSRLGAARFFQVCESCRQRHKVVLGEQKIKTRPLSGRHRRVTSWKSRDRSREFAVQAIL